MAFKIEQIDRAIEWTIMDEVIAKGYWPDKRAFITANDKDGYNAAIAAMSSKINVFGVGNFKDRKDLETNNIIIDRNNGLGDGTIGFSDPYRFELKANKKWKKIYSGEGSSNVEYEIRFVCDDITLDRALTMIMQEAIGQRKFLHGINEDLTEIEETFFIERNGPPGDVSDKDYLERVFRYIVKDVFIDVDKIVEDDISPMTSMTPALNIDDPNGPDVQYPRDMNDVAENGMSVSDYFIGMMQEIQAWYKFLSVRLYANDTQPHALKDLINPGAAPAVNSGLTFTPFQGFAKTAGGQYLNNKFSPQDIDGFTLTNFSYSIFVTSIPDNGLMELFGLTDSGLGVSFYLKSDGTLGLNAKGNSNSLLSIPAIQVKENTLYTLNSRNRFQLELFEGSKIIAVLEIEPTAIPAGHFAELNIFNQADVPQGTSIAGGIGFSAIGKGLMGMEVKELNEVMRFFMTQVGVIL